MRAREPCLSRGQTTDTPASDRLRTLITIFTIHNESQSEKIREMNDTGVVIHVGKFTHGFRYTEMLLPLPVAARAYLNGNLWTVISTLKKRAPNFVLCLISPVFLVF